MALGPVVLQLNQPSLFPNSTVHLEPPSLNKKATQIALQSNVNRRTGSTILATVSLLLVKQAIFSTQTADAFDFRITAPDQTLDEAMSGIRGHAESLLQVKDLLDAESWKEAQKALRKSSSYLKQDIYTIIQGKPGSERPLLRKLYFNLFNTVTRLDYAARDKNVTLVRVCYDNIATALNEILSRI